MLSLQQNEGSVRAWASIIPLRCRDWYRHKKRWECNNTGSTKCKSEHIMAEDPLCPLWLLAKLVPMPLYSCCYRSSYELPRRCVSAFSHSHVTCLQNLWASLSCWPPDMSIPQDGCPWLPQAVSVLTRRADTEHGPRPGAWVPIRSGCWHGSCCCFGPGQLVLSQAMPGHSWELARARDQSQLTGWGYFGG